MKATLSFLQKRLSERKANLTLRSLPTHNSKIDFCSNDYLGFARSQELKNKIEGALQQYREYSLGSTGSRLISGNSDFLEQLEREIALFHGVESGLIFNSGYDANVGLFSSIPQRGDTVIADEFAHASIIDGIRLSNANRYTFKHNDLNNLEEKLKVAKGKIFIAVESVYSMDGDEAPLKEIVDLSDQYGAAVIVDEAHAIGIFGKQGKGIVSQMNLENQVFARVITFGKALGTHGALILGSNLLKNYLINFARSFIYTTASPFHTHLCIKKAYEYLLEKDHPSLLDQKVKLFKSYLKNSSKNFIPSRSPIQSLLVSGNEQARNLANALQEQGFNVRAILSPTVPKGKERLRICLHTFNTDEEIKALAAILEK